ncbi:UNVERIFIED_CONTAM: hypothetical protein GTU68_022231 [Idotea baltica]|nr:hypothetical protein [Idotea baltica]
MSSKYDRKDHYHQKAKQEGYRSRAAYKLLEINNKYKIMKVGSKVVDLGSWPGGWLQVASKLTKNHGKVIGIDLVEIDPIKNVDFITGDIRDEESMEKIISLAGSKIDALISDMSPKLTGIKTADRIAVVGLAEMAFYVAEQILKPGGHFLIKVFKSNETEEFIRSIRSRFERIVKSELKSTRKTSNEFYLLGLNFKDS